MGNNLSYLILLNSKNGDVIEPKREEPLFIENFTALYNYSYPSCEVVVQYKILIL